MIEIRNLNFSFAKNSIFEDFSIKIDGKGSTLLTGPNGSGKTTLLQLIGGVLKPAQGEIIFDGVSLAGLTIREQSKIRSVAPQRRIFELAFTVEEILSIIKIKDRALHSEKVLTHLGLIDLMERKVTELSLGQQQRVSVALALIQSAKYYLLDEPLSAQDSHHTERFIELIGELSKETGILVISHNTGQLVNYFDESINLS